MTLPGTHFTVIVIGHSSPYFMSRVPLTRGSLHSQSRWQGAARDARPDGFKSIWRPTEWVVTV